MGLVGMVIYYYPSFLRQVKKLPKAIREFAVEQTKLFMKDPRDPVLKLHKLTGRLKGNFAFSINFRYRIVLEIRGNQAFFHSIGDHGVYK